MIIELSFKIIINLMGSDPEVFDNDRDGVILQIFKIIQYYYNGFVTLS